MSARQHYLIVENRGYCGGCEYCGSVAETAYCACGGDEDCPDMTPWPSPAEQAEIDRFGIFAEEES